MNIKSPREDAASALPAAAISALQHGNKIEAIKIVREEQHIGLKEAKDAVDSYVRSQPVLQAPLAAAQSETKRSALLWLAVLIGLALMAYYFFSKP